MDLYFRKYSDYRRGTRITVSDFEDLKEEYEKSLNNDSDNESGSDNESNEQEITDDDIDKYVMNDENLLDIVVMDDNLIPNEYNIYLIHGCIYEIHHILNTDNLSYAKIILKQLFSDINNCQPFIVTGFTCSYKEEGGYSDPLPPLLIDGKPLIENTIKKKIENHCDDYCVAVIIKNKQLIDYEQILPLF